MDANHFRELVRRLIINFQRPEPKNEAMDLWYMSCRYIPTEPLVWIEAQIRDEESFPKNLPAMIRRLYRQWLEAHPEKAAKEVLGCDRCHQGFLTLAKAEKDGRPANYLLRCKCNGGKLSRSELIGLGYGRPVGSAIHTYHSPFPVLTWEQPEPKSGSIRQEDIEAAIPF